MTQRLNLQKQIDRNTCPEPNTGCLLWLGRVSPKGYGQVTIRGEASTTRGHPKRCTVRAHRLAWYLAHNSVWPSMLVLHKCDTPACVNADHLFLGTHDDNMADRSAKGRTAGGDYCQSAKTHCPQGHQYSGDNLVINSVKGRECRTCNINKCRAYRKRLVEKHEH